MLVVREHGIIVSNSASPFGIGGEKGGSTVACAFDGGVAREGLSSFVLTVARRDQPLDTKRQCLDERLLHHGVMVAGYEQHLHRTLQSIAPTEIGPSMGRNGCADHNCPDVDWTNLPLHHPLVIFFSSEEDRTCPRERILNDGILACAERRSDAA